MAKSLKTAAFFNLKGGVGKTSSAVNVAVAAGQAGLRTLLWDLDPQGAAGWILLDEDEPTASAKKLINGKEALGGAIRRTRFPGVDVIPGSLANRKLDAWLAKRSNRTALRKLGKALAPAYDLLILDCPPSMGSLAENIFAGSDLLAIPIIPSPLSLRALEQVSSFCETNKFKVDIAPFFSMVDARRKLHKDWLYNPPKAMQNRLNTFIAYRSAVEKMTLIGQPLLAYAPHDPAAVRYATLFQEMASRLGIAPQND